MLFIRTKTQNLQIFGVIPFVKIQNDRLLLDETLKTKSQGPQGWGLGPGGEYRVGVVGEGGEGYYRKGSYAGLATPGRISPVLST